MTARTHQPSDLLIVDSDTHLSEPWDLWTSRAPERLHDQLPHVREVDGAMAWTCGGKYIGPAMAACVIDDQNEKRLGAEYLFSHMVHEVAAGASQVGPRLEVMDSQGVWAQILYPNAVGFGGQQLGQIDDPEIRLLCVTLFNDAMAEMQRESGERLFPMGVLPWWDMDLTLREVERIREIGLTGVNTIADPQEYGLTDLSTAEWDPLWSALEDAGLPLNFHIGASATQRSYIGTASWPSRSDDEKLALGSGMLYLSNARVIGNLIFGGVLERHPGLKVVSVESGVGWLPFYLQALDYQLDETAPELRTKLSLKPSEFFRRQFAACFWFENELLLPSIEYLGIDNCLFESDYPHPTCLYPNPVERALEVFEGADDVLRRKVFGENAVRIYQLPVNGV